MLASSSDNSSGSITQFNFHQAENKISIEYTNASIRNLYIYSFDNLARKTQITIQDGMNTYTTNYSYDSLGKLNKLIDRNGNLTIDYDYHLFRGQLNAIAL